MQNTVNDQKKIKVILIYIFKIPQTIYIQYINSNFFNKKIHESV